MSGVSHLALVFGSIMGAGAFLLVGLGGGTFIDMFVHGISLTVIWTLLTHLFLYGFEPAPAGFSPKTNKEEA